MLPLERVVRQKIDAQLRLAGWLLQNLKDLDLHASNALAIREFPLTSGFADYLLVLNGEAVGVVEAKRSGTLSGVHEQSSVYQASAPAHPSAIRFLRSPLPFSYETNGDSLQFTNRLEPDARSREIFHFQRPSALEAWLKQAPIGTPPDLNDLLRSQVRRLPPLHRDGLRDCQYEAIKSLERSFATQQPRALVQMATGSGKTYMAISQIYRLLRFGGAKRVLFLVDRNNLGQQAYNEFQQYVAPDSGRRFSDLYNVQLLSSNHLDSAAEVHITTIQRLYSILRGKDEPELPDEKSLFVAENDEDAPDDENEPVAEVQYRPDLPVEYFDVIFIDECHRSIYHKWREVLSYFDAFQVGLSATPEQRAFGFFQRNLVSEYSYERSVADGVNVDYLLYRINTDITEHGSRVEQGIVLPRRNKLTRRRRYEMLQDDLVYDGPQLDHDVVAEDQIRTVLSAYRDNLPTIFPGRTVVPKTVIFAKDDSHAEDILKMVREVFDKGNDFAKKITYSVTKVKPEELINEFRNAYNPRIVVSVDMISTGTDIRPLEVLLFMRKIRSRTFFEQMKGRGCRTILPANLQAVTPDAHEKTHFIVVDAVGVTRNLRQDNPPLDRKASLSLEKLMQLAADGVYDEDSLLTLAGRLGKMTRRISGNENQNLLDLCGKDIHTLALNLVDAVDIDQQTELAQQLSGDDAPDAHYLEEATLQLAQQACAPFKNPQVRELLLHVKAREEQIIDDVSQDRVTMAQFDEKQALATISSFRAFMEQHREQISQFELAYSARSAQQLARIVDELAQEIKQPQSGLTLTTDRLWQSYQTLDQSRVNGNTTKQGLADIYVLLRYNIAVDRGENALLESLALSARRNFDVWIEDQEQLRQRPFSEEQYRWLERIRDRIILDLYFTFSDFDLQPFARDGGRVRAHQLFNAQELDSILKDLNERLIA